MDSEAERDWNLGDVETNEQILGRHIDGYCGGDSKASDHYCW